MFNIKKSFIIIIFFLSSFVFFTSCDNDPNQSAAFTGVRVIDNSYSPPVVRINEGGKVRFNNWGNNLFALSTSTRTPFRLMWNNIGIKLFSNLTILVISCL